jgi:hypothetical protein
MESSIYIYSGKNINNRDKPNDKNKYYQNGNQLMIIFLISNTLPIAS